MPGVPLTPEQEELRDSVKEKVDEFNRELEKGSAATPLGTLRMGDLIPEMAPMAHELHMSLKDSGTEPKHHRYMYENRRVLPDDPEFYAHIHPVQDLLAFIDDVNANDDPVDVTIGEEFEFKVWSNRWGHYDQYRITRTGTGWRVEHIVINGDCDKTADPFLYANFDQDSINYPHDLGFYMELLWEKAHDEGLLKKQVQAGLNDLAEWVSIVERATPDLEVWGKENG